EAYTRQSGAIARLVKTISAAARRVWGGLSRRGRAPRRGRARDDGTARAIVEARGPPPALPSLREAFRPRLGCVGRSYDRPTGNARGRPKQAGSQRDVAERTGESSAEQERIDRRVARLARSLSG